MSYADDEASLPRAYSDRINAELMKVRLSSARHGRTDGRMDGRTDGLTSTFSFFYFTRD